MSERFVSGSDYLRELGESYEAFKNILPRLNNEAFEYQKKLNARSEIGIESFLHDFAIDAEERRRAIERWKTGESLPKAMPDQIARIKSALPGFVYINPEVLGAIKVERVRNFRVDVVVEEILLEIASRLPRKIDAYRYHQDYAHDTLNVPGLGKIKVTLHETGNGIFKSIGTVESKKFKIWNCRSSGIHYLNLYNEISKPQIVVIKPKQIELDLYNEDGIFVGYKGKRFTNVGWKTSVGSGYESDKYRDDLHRTYSGPNDMASPNEGYVDNKGWQNDNTVLSWEKIENEAIVWLVDNVLNPIKRSVKPKVQIDLPPREEPFPSEKIGPIFSFVEMRDVERIVRIKDNPSKAYPHERAAVQPGRRFFSLGTNRGKLPEIVHDGYIWCGLGKVDSDRQTSGRIANQEIRTDRFLGGNEAIVEIKPLTATDIYIIDWQEWDDYRNRTFTPTHDELTNSEVLEMYQQVGKTFVPITEYKGGYKNPVVLIGRNIELEEIGKIVLPHEQE